LNSAFEQFIVSTNAVLKAGVLAFLISTLVSNGRRLTMHIKEHIFNTGT
jgi:hypothetical protein